MTKAFTEQIFRTSYRDDFADSDNYHRILFNSGRALQARELTQLQTIIQKEIERFGSNIFTDGAAMQSGGVKINNAYEFIKIASTTSLPSDLTTLSNVVFTGQTSGIKVRVLEAVAAESGDPDTLYVQYLDLPSGSAGTTSPKVTPGEILSGTVSGSTLNLRVQVTDTAANPATGFGSQFSTGPGSFFVQGHFVFAVPQSIIVSKYSNNFSGTVGFKIIQDIVTSSDDEDLFDNQGASPNRSSPGADRYRIRLVLINKTELGADENFVYVAEIFAGNIVDKPSSSEGLNSTKDLLAVRTFEESGNYIKKYFKSFLEPNDDDSFKLRVEPGIAYVNGYRVAKKSPTSLFVPKAQDTFTQDNDAISVDYGNYFEFDSGKGMLNFDTCELVDLMSGTEYSGDSIGTARVRAIREGTGLNYNLHLFDIRRTNDSYSLRDVRSIGTGSSTFVDLVLDTSSNSILKEPDKKGLLFDTPIRRPKGFTSVSLSVARRFSDTTDGSGDVTITLSAANENFENTGDWIISTAATAIETGYSISLGSGATSATISGLPSSTPVEILAYVKKGTGKIRQKTLTETTVTATLDSDGEGLKYIPLGQSDIFSVNRVRKNDSDGASVFNAFQLDAGQRDTHYADGRLIYSGSGLDSDEQNVFVRFKYFAHGTGDFFAVSSYNGQVEYRDIPAHRLQNGNLVSLRDVLDFRPSTNGSGAFVSSRVSELPQPTDLVEADAEYYLPRLDKLVLSETGELRYITGTSSLQPKFPSTPKECIDLYKFELNPNTLHTKDLKSRLLPLKGYTMEDIGKIEKKLEKVEELATLTLLELSTTQLKSLDSSGVDRAKSGFFVDNFANQRYSDVKNPEYRAAIDPRQKFVRPTFKEHSIDLHYDSSHVDQLRVVKYGDLIMLDHDEITYKNQPFASKTENINPFFVERIQGELLLSPASDNWKESEVAAPRIIDGGTELDTRQALLWNEWEWNWGGVDVNDLQVGATSTNVTGTSTSQTINVSEPRLTGTNVTETVGEWVVTGTTSTTTELGSQETIVSQETEEVIRPVIDNWFLSDGARDGFGAGDWTEEVPVWVEVATPTTTETRTEFETVDTTTREQTTTVTTENEFTTDTEYVTNTTTTTTVNRIASESTVREVVDNRIVDVAFIPFMRSRKVSFRATGLRPNTRFFPFFDGTDVGAFCRSKTFVRHSDRPSTEETTNLAPSIEHSEGSTSLVSNTNGVIEGEFEIPNNSAMRFRTGRREFALYDISVYNTKDALCTATAYYHAEGVLETFQDTVLSTRILEIVGSQATTSNTNVRTEQSISTETLVSSTVATDVQEERTISEVVTTSQTGSTVSATQPVTTTTVPVDPEPTPEVTPDTSIRPTPLDLSEIDFSILDFRGPSIYFDPLAQTFDVPDVNGVFLTRIRIYFKSKDTNNIPVKLELRPVVEGRPTSERIPGSLVVKNPSQVNLVPNDTIASMEANGTDFVFDEPVFLPGGQEYAIVLRSDSMEYRVYISEIYDFVLGSTEKRISKQPTLGSLFKSQNSRLWEADQRQDLAFRMYRADFENSGNVILENVQVPPSILTKNPFYMDSGSSDVFVINRGHGLRQGDVTTITGLDSSTVYASGVKGSSLLGQRTVTSVDGTGYKFEADSAATSTGRFGGGRARGSQNMNFDLLRLDVDTLQPETTNITFSGKFTSASSLVDSDQGRFTKDTSYRLIKNKNNFEFSNPKAIYTEVEETAELVNAGLGKSSTIQCTMTTTDSRVSPVIDMQRASMVLVGNQIDKQDSAATTGFNVPIRFVPETNPFLGSSLAKHITSPTELTEEAVGLKILLAANKPPGSDFQVYYHVADESENIRRKNWILVEPEQNLPADNNRKVFREYRYIVGGIGGTMDPFTKFQVKIVFRSTNSAKVPVIRDLRAIALSV